MPGISAVAHMNLTNKVRSAVHEGMDGWKENGCPALGAEVEVGWRGKAGAASDVIRGDWEEGVGGGLCPEKSLISTPTGAVI